MSDKPSTAILGVHMPVLPKPQRIALFSFEEACEVFYYANPQRFIVYVVNPDTMTVAQVNSVAEAHAFFKGA